MMRLSRIRLSILRLGCAIVAMVMTMMVVTVQAQTGSGTCQKISEVCVDSGTKIINGTSVTRDCWKYQAQYQCRGGLSNDCSNLVNQGCAPLSSHCTTPDELVGCSLWTYQYRCLSQAAKVDTMTNCAGQTFCANGSCYDTGYVNDADFAQTVTYLEAARQAGKYLDPNDLRIFKGYGGQCTNVLRGLKNCCKKGTGMDIGMFNNLSLMMGAGKAVKGATTLAYSNPSNYTFDGLYGDAPQSLMSGFSTLFEGGFTTVFNTEAFISNLTPSYWTVAMLALQYSGLLSCDKAEKELVLKKDGRLCIQVGQYCSKRVLKACVESKEGYCCYNSRLARLINAQGLQQLGRGFGSPENPQCSGFSVAELQQLDFSKMDLTEFYNEIVPELPNVDQLKQDIKSRTVGKTQDPKVRCYHGGQC
jgi:conjugal transfer mating pair stabilization protein TraN